MKRMKIRKARPTDVKTIIQLIRELARFEKLENEVVVTPQILKKSLFGRDKYAHVLLGEVDGKPISYAIYFFNFSTFLGRPGLYLEDLYVSPDYRSSGFGLQLLKELAKIAKTKNCGRMEWAVLDWNTRAMDFYVSLGAESKGDWLIHRLTEKSIIKLAK